MDYTNHTFKFPGFLKAQQLSHYIEEAEIRPDVEKWLKNNLKLLADAIGEATGNKDQEILYINLMQFLSSMVYPFLLNKYGCIIGGLDFSNETLREKYISTILDGVLQDND